MAKICVYTCITGNYDSLIELKKKEDGIDYICFTNNKKITSKTWTVKYLEDNLPNQLLARKIKILGAKELEPYDTLIWLDGCTSIKTSIYKFLKTECDSNEYDLFTFKHDERQNIQEEAGMVVKLKKEKLERVQNLFAFFRKEGFEDNAHLVQSNVLVKKNHSKKLAEFLKYWFFCVENYCIRDQLSFSYAEWKSGAKIKRIPLSMHENFYFDWQPWHNRNAFSFEQFQVFPTNGIIYRINDIQVGNYTRKFGKYFLSFSCPCDCTKLDIDLGLEYYGKQKKIELNYSYSVYNGISDNDYILVWNYPILVLEGNFLKGQEIKISFSCQFLNFDEFSECIKKIFCTKQLQIERQQQKYQQQILELKKQQNQLSLENQFLLDEIHAITNSKRWKLFNFFHLSHLKELKSQDILHMSNDEIDKK